MGWFRLRCSFDKAQDGVRYPISAVPVPLQGLLETVRLTHRHRDGRLGSRLHVCCGVGAPLCPCGPRPVLGSSPTSIAATSGSPRRATTMTPSLTAPASTLEAASTPMASRAFAQCSSAARWPCVTRWPGPGLYVNGLRPSQHRAARSRHADDAGGFGDGRQAAALL